MTRHRSVVLALAFLAPALHAQTPTPQRITFDDAIRIALRQSTSVQQAENANALDGVQVKQQKLAFLPDLRASASTAENVGRNFSQTDGQIIDQMSQSMSAGLSSSLTLFDGFKSTSALAQAKLDEQASGKDLARAKQTAVFTVASNFLGLVTQREQLGVQQENLASQQAQEAQIKQFVDAGTRPVSDLYQQQANVAAAKASVVDAQRAVDLAEVDLIQTLQLDPRASYDFATPAIPAATTGANVDLDALVTSALAHRADLIAQEARVDAAAQGVNQASASRWPTISVSAGYNTAFSSSADAALFSQLNDRRGGSIGIGISIPLFDKGSASLATQSAQIQQDNARLALEQQKRQVALDVRRAVLDLRSAGEQLTAADAQKKAAEMALTATQQRYQVGKATLVEVSQARAAQVQAESAQVKAKYTLTFQRSLLSYYTGEMDPAKVSIG
jgi:outer membrane protein